MMQTQIPRLKDLPKWPVDKHGKLIYQGTQGSLGRPLGFCPIERRRARVPHEFVPPFGPEVFDHEQYPGAFHLFLTGEYLRWKMLAVLPVEILIIRAGLKKKGD